MEQVEILHPDMANENRWKNNDVKLLLTAENDEDMAINLRIRTRYSMSQELALHRKKAMGTKTAGFKAEWDEYCAFVQECIDDIRAEI